MELVGELGLRDHARYGVGTSFRLGIAIGPSRAGLGSWGFKARLRMMYLDPLGKATGCSSKASGASTSGLSVGVTIQFGRFFSLAPQVPK